MRHCGSGCAAQLKRDVALALKLQDMYDRYRNQISCLIEQYRLPEVSTIATDPAMPNNEMTRQKCESVSVRLSSLGADRIASHGSANRMASAASRGTAVAEAFGSDCVV